MFLQVITFPTLISTSRPFPESEQRSAHFCCKGPDISVFIPVAQMVSVTTTQLCHSQYISEWGWPYANKTLFTKTGVRPDLAEGLKFAEP